MERPHQVLLLSAKNKNLSLSWAQTYPNWRVRLDNCINKHSTGMVDGV